MNEVGKKSRGLQAPSLLERIVARRSGNEKGWFRIWIRVQGFDDPTGEAAERLARCNGKYIVIGVALLILLTGCVIAFIGWARKWW